MSTKQLTVLIADDEKPARDRILSLLKNYPVFLVVAECENCEQVVSRALKFKPDLLFLDINMPGDSIFQVLSLLVYKPMVVFQTAYSEFGVEAFDIDAVDYLLKPISRERFKKTVDKVLSTYDSLNETDQLSVKSGDVFKIVHFKDILRISFEDGFSFLYTKKGRVFSDKPLSYFEESLPSSTFYRINRNDIICINEIINVTPSNTGIYVVESSDTFKMQVSRRRYQGLKALLEK